MFEYKPFILIDGSAFHLNFATPAKRHANKTLVGFVNYLKETCAFDIQVFTRQTLDKFTANLKRLGLTGIPVKRWQDISDMHADVIIWPQNKGRIAPASCHVLIRPENIRPDTLENFINTIDRRLEHSIHKQDFVPGWVDDRLDRIREKIRLTRRFHDFGDVWDTTRRLPAVKNLLSAFERAARCDGKICAEDIVLGQLYAYFTSAVAARKKSAALLELRRFLKADFRENNVDRLYNDTLYDHDGRRYEFFGYDVLHREHTALKPLARDHARLLDDALRAIHTAVRAEPRLSAPK